MLRPSRLLLTIVVVAFVVAGAPHRVAHAAPTLPEVGTPVVFPLGTDGGAVTITVTQIVDPFGALGGGTPPAGIRYVYVGLTVANGGQAPLAVDPKAVFVVDAARDVAAYPAAAGSAIRRRGAIGVAGAPVPFAGGATDAQRPSPLQTSSPQQAVASAPAVSSQSAPSPAQAASHAFAAVQTSPCPQCSSSSIPQHAWATHPIPPVP
jgi:hypothetical protein